MAMIRLTTIANRTTASHAEVLSRSAQSTPRQPSSSTESSDCRRSGLVAARFAIDPERPYDRANSAPESGHLRRYANANNAMALPSFRVKREGLDEPVKILMTVKKRLDEHAFILAVSTNVVDIVGQA